MREIKFRVPYIQFEARGFAYYNLLDIAQGNIDYHDLDWEKAGQYTGFKDKNGKEIYESDVVQASKSWTSEVIQRFKSTVDLDIDIFTLKKDLDTGKELDWMRLSDYELEVIGNIYDNPELLGDK